MAPAPTTPPSSNGGGDVMDDVERSELVRIWHSNRREVLDVKSTEEILATAPLSVAFLAGRDGSGGATSSKAVMAAIRNSMTADCYAFIVRIRKFVLAYLKQALYLGGGDGGGGTDSAAPSSSFDSRALSTSCLRGLLRMIVVVVSASSEDDDEQHDDGGGDDGSCSSDDDADDNNNGGPNSSRSRGDRSKNKTKRIVVLPKGRRVLGLPHDAFLSELNEYELRVRGLSSSKNNGHDDNNSNNIKAARDEFLRKHSFGAYLYHFPGDGLMALSCAVRLAILGAYKCQRQTLRQVRTSAAQDDDVPQFLDNSQLVVRFVRVEPRIPLMDVKTGIVGKFVSVVGYVVKAKAKRLRVATADFICTKCGTIVTHAFYNNGGGGSGSSQYTPMPTRCTGTGTGTGNNSSNNGGKDNRRTGCQSRSFELIRPTAKYASVQELKLQEATEESSAYAGRTPRQITVKLAQDLVDKTRPGDTVAVAAIVAAEAVGDGKRSGGGGGGGGRNRYGRRNGAAGGSTSTTYHLYLQGHSITTTSESNSGDQQRRNDENDISHAAVYSNRQLQGITQLCHADHRCFSLTERRAFPFDLLVRSLCPAIIGHNAVKAGLLLCLLGGTPQTSPHDSTDQSQLSIRSNSHVLVVGDPGMGKSQMLLAASQLAARSVYVGGNTSSTTGLTVTLTKEERGESAIEVGALVLADQGVCCIDEFDKMAKNHQDGLLEAMEQQQVSIAKAGVVASLPARCSVIAAANPKHGSYNMDKTVAENLNMAKPILSRFDLVFILRDRADKALDQRVSSNIVNLYRNKSNATSQSTAMPQTAEYAATSNGQNFAGEMGDGRMPLADRLTWVHDFQKQPLPASLVRDYIAYAREYCRPKFTPEAAAVLKDYYMELRYPSDGRRKRDTVPITTRQLEALIRLCQARAKACLRDFVLREDALDVVELMSISVEQVHSDEGGIVDRGRGGAGGKSNRKRKKAFVNELHRIVGVGAECGLDDLRRIADKVNCELNEFTEFVDDLRSEGILLKKANGRFQVST